MTNKVFPIHTKTACQLKWVWSSIYLTYGTTASCHRTNQHKFDTDKFNFHNTPEKLDDRQRMLKGQWPKKGCEYCKNIESAGGSSDRITNLDFWSFDPPQELQADPTTTSVTPRILEIYFSNLCNLKCTYCGPNFSTLWNEELQRYGEPGFIIDSNFEINKQKCFAWLKNNISELHQLNILGGEPLYQDEFDQLLDILELHPSPELTLTFFSNLAVAHNKLVDKINRIELLIKQGKIKRLIITASLDCWGNEAEFARFPLNLNIWEKNFNYLLVREWVTLVIGSTITPITIKSLHVLFDKINYWNQTRPVYWYGNSVTDPTYLTIDMFGNVFEEDFNQAINLMPDQLPEHKSVKEYLKGIRDQSANSQPDIKKIKNLFKFLEKMDHRRGTKWRSVYPWLEELFCKHLGE